MKRLLLALFFFSLTTQAEAMGGTIGPIAKFAQVGNGGLFTLGGRINAHFLDRYIAGIGGHGSLAQTTLAIDGINEQVGYYYGALGLGVRFFPDSFIHLTNYNNFGLGQLHLKNRGQKSLVFSIEPELNVEVDLLSLMRIGTGLSYRFMFAKDLTVSNASLFGVGGQLYVEFGWL